MKKISIVIPAYNEAANIPELTKRLGAVYDKMPQYQFETLIVENGSKDNTWEEIIKITQKDSRFQGLQLSKNFTAPGGITAGLEYITGDAAIIMCADLQDPPEKIPDFLQQWELGYDMVYQLITERQGIGFFYKIASNIFHWLMSVLTSGEFVRNATVYRLMDRKVYTAFNQLRETNRYFTGLCNWLGFKTVGIQFAREKRFAGESKAQITVVLKIALNGIFSFSYMPLRVVTYFGLIVSSASFLFLIYIVIEVLKNGLKTIPGLATQISITLLFFGFLFLSLGIIGEYLIRIYDEVKQRPKFIIRNSTHDLSKT